MCLEAPTSGGWLKAWGWKLGCSGFVVKLTAEKALQIADPGEGLRRVKKVILSITE